MTRKRLVGADRRASILEAATKVFAEHGLNGAKTQKIAAEAEVSEALIFRHFQSKDQLYRAVLRKLITDQNESFQETGLPTPDTAGLVQMMKGYFTYVLNSRNQPHPERIRMLYASLAGDGAYARLVYRRALRISLGPLQRALDGARAAGDLVGTPIDAANFMALTEHIGSYVSIARLPDKPIIQYAGDDAELLRQLVWFCGRGIGLTEEALRKHFDAPAAGPAIAQPPAAKAKRSPRRSPRKAETGG